MILMDDCSRRLSGLPAVLWFSFFICIFLFACNENPPDSSVIPPKPAFIEIDDIQVPVFATAVEQINYTRSWFARIQERRAALEAFIVLFPEEKRYCGLASLDLAYLHLGGDYRFAHEYSCFAAIKAYKAILERYREFGDIVVKAHWYIGWIYSDLLNDKEKGVKKYQEIVQHYPHEKVTLLSPAPWVSIIYQTDENVNIALSDRPVNKWAALALVEIIRYAQSEAIAWSAFLELWQNYRENVVTGFGLKVMLQRRFHTGDILKLAREYMEKEFSNVYILGDIQKEINDISRMEGSIVR